MGRDRKFHGRPVTSGPRAGRARGERPLREDLVLQACLEIYGAIRHEGRLADRALEFTLRRKSGLYSNERRAVAERVYGLLRRQLAADFFLERAVPGFSRLPATQKDLLRLAAARVLSGERPDRVTKTSSLSAEEAGVIVELGAKGLPLTGLSAEERFSLEHSLPPPIAARFRLEFGAEARAAAAAMNERAPLTIRCNTLKISRDELSRRLTVDGVEPFPTPLSPLGLTTHTRVNVFGLEAFREGLFEVQDEGSQLLGMLVDPPPTFVVDACAGAGGKTLQLAAAMKNRGDLHALDVDSRKIDELRKRARRAGAHNVRTRVVPDDEAGVERALAELKDRADRVLVDAPCSGTGVFRRNPDARYRLQENDFAAFAERQLRLLVRYSTLVKPGGRLVYGTCSVLREENEAVILRFLSNNPEFSLKPVAEVLSPPLGAQVADGEFLKLCPHRHGTDGFFGAVLVRSRNTKVV